MGLFNNINGNIVQGLMGNLSEMTVEKITERFGMYLMEGEEIKTGFALVRDVIIFTDRRVISIDKQGSTGIKARIESIYLDSIISVSVETAGFGIDDSEITIDYIESPYFRASGGVEISQKTMEFPKSYQIQSLYTWLQEVAYQNHLNINR